MGTLARANNHTKCSFPGTTTDACSQFVMKATEAVADRQVLPTSTELAKMPLKCQQMAGSLVTAAPAA